MVNSRFFFFIPNNLKVYPNVIFLWFHYKNIHQIRKFYPSLFERLTKPIMKKKIISSSSLIACCLFFYCLAWFCCKVHAVEMEHFDLLTSFKCRNLKKDLINITQTMIEKMAYVDHTTTELNILCMIVLQN